MLGEKSKSRLAQCVKPLQQIVQLAADGVDRGDLRHFGITDISVQTGYRGKDAQEEAFDRGDSKLHFPYSAHNRFPSNAADVVPYPELWSDATKCHVLHAYATGIACALGVPLHHIDWDPAHIEVK